RSGRGIALALVSNSRRSEFVPRRRRPPGSRVAMSATRLGSPRSADECRQRETTGMMPLDGGLIIARSNSVPKSDALGHETTGEMVGTRAGTPAFSFEGGASRVHGPNWSKQNEDESVGGRRTCGCARLSRGELWTGQGRPEIPEGGDRGQPGRGADGSTGAEERQQRWRSLVRPDAAKGSLRGQSEGNGRGQLAGR